MLVGQLAWHCSADWTRRPTRPARPARPAMLAIFATVALIAAAVAAEAPYYSNRPSAQVPSFSYSPGLQSVSQPQPAPAPAPQHAAPLPRPAPNQYVQYPPTVNLPQPQQQYSGYNYERPSIAPAFVYNPPPHPAVNLLPQPLPQPIQLFNYPSQPQPQRYAPQQGYSYAQPQAYSLASQQNLPAQSPQVSFRSQPQIQYTQPQQQLQYTQPQQQLQYTQPQQQIQYTQPQQQLQYTQTQFQQAQQFPTQAVAQPSFNQNQQSVVLDNHVVSQVQNILAQNEESQARNLGYYHRISGVSLEGVSPSVELSAFVQRVPLTSSSAAAAQSQPLSLPSLQELARGSQQSVSSASGALSSVSSTADSSSYGLPTVVDNRKAPEPTNYNFAPSQSQSSSAYGPPN